MRSRSPLGVSLTNASEGPKSSWGGGAVQREPRRRGPACRRHILGIYSEYLAKGMSPAELDLDVHTDIGSLTYRGLKLSARNRNVAGISLNGNYRRCR